jgi:hypothetical protein
MTKIHSKRVIHLDPFTVQGETLAALEAEIEAQADDDIPDIKSISKVVIDSNEDGGLDSHATIFTAQSDGGDGSA